MEELKKMLENVSDSYDGFVLGVLNYCKGRTDRIEQMSTYVLDNPNIKSSDIVEKMISDPDFWEDEGTVHIMAPQAIAG